MHNLISIPAGGFSRIQSHLTTFKFIKKIQQKLLNRLIPNLKCNESIYNIHSSIGAKSIILKLRLKQMLIVMEKQIIMA